MARVIHGSVKDIVIEEEPTSTSYGSGFFIYRPDWSCYDWAHGDYQMPNQIPGKDVAQCLTNAYFFEQIARMGIPTTYFGLVDSETHQLLKLPEEIRPTNTMAIDIARVIRPENIDKNNEPTYVEFQTDVRSAVVPLEVIFRFGLPPGSSAFKRMRRGDCRKEFFGLSEVPRTEDPIWFGIPRMDYSTKFDPRGDIYDFGRDEYRRISGLTEAEMAVIDRTTQTIAWTLFDAYRRIGMDLWDGKIEFVFAPKATGERRIDLGDAPGALDEVRVLIEGRQLSKQFGRDVYKFTQPEWVQACSEEEARGGHGDWQQRVLDRGLSPRPFTPAELDLFSGIYTSVANALWEKEVISGAPTIEEVKREYDDYMKTLR